MVLPVVNAVWIGNRLGEVHAACLTSFVRSGHVVRLHCYEAIADLPKGVEAVDATALWPADRLLRYPNGSYAISANLLRYRIMALGLGLYVDCDVYCLRAIDDTHYIFGYESNTDVNTAVLKLPLDSPVVADLAAIDEGWLPPWQEEQHRKPLAEYAWGTTGPRAFSYFARQHGVMRHGRPIDVFYPVHHQQTKLLADPDVNLSDLITPRTRYLHAYNQTSARHFAASPPKGSPLWQLIALSES